jgi:hypothetical protein
MGKSEAHLLVEQGDDGALHVRAEGKADEF